MDLRFASADMASLGELKTEVLCIPFFADELPMRGPGGLIDWRLCGKISHLQRRGRMLGQVGEAVLMPARPRFMTERLLWLGAGQVAEMDARRFRQVVVDGLGRLHKLRVRTAALVLPGRVGERVSAAEAIEWFLELSADFSEKLDELIVLESGEAQRTMRQLVERARRRMLADF